MNIFILCTGRCGSMTFIKACDHITNFSSGHESRSGMLGADRLDYPENHIEADNRLSWLLGRLDKCYGDNAFYVHLTRDTKETAHSYSKRYSSGIMNAYRGEGILLGLPEESDPISVALDYCETVNSNIEHFLKDKSHKLEIRLEHIEQDFIKFWDLIGAIGDLNASLGEFSTHYNKSKPPAQIPKKSFILRVFHKLRRLLINLPKYVIDT